MDDQDRAILALAATPYRYPAQREEKAYVEFGLTPTLFWAAVGRLLEIAEAEREMPAEVRRLRKVAARRAGARSGAVSHRVHG